MPNRDDLPREIWALVWEFAWGLNMKKHPFDDLERVYDIQCSIPPIFFKDRVEPLTWVKEAWDEYFKNLRTEMYQLFTPNPFKKGNAYLPFALVHEDVWSRIPSFVLETLKPSGVHELVTYRGCLWRRLQRHYARPVLQWNKSLEEFFLPLSDLKQSHFLEFSWKSRFTSEVLEALQGAAWLSSALP